MSSEAVLPGVAEQGGHGSGGTSLLPGWPGGCELCLCNRDED